MKKVLIVSDNFQLTGGFVKLIEESRHDRELFEFRCSAGSEAAMSSALGFLVKSINVKTEFESILREFHLVISLHCKQLFPTELVRGVKCINVHPGLNPYNRGWFPQVFSILNGLPTGATIHEIDDELDHGDIIASKEVENYPWDTSIDIYTRVLKAELDLLKENLNSILSLNYTTKKPFEEGNVNLKSDFNKLCKLDMEKTQSVQETIDLLRALTHGNYQNAYFVEPKTGKKVFVSVTLNPEE